MPELRPPGRLRRLSSNRTLLTALPSVVLAALAFAVAYYFVEPAPPRHVRIAAPDEAGARWYARKYAEILARDHVVLEVVPVEGSQQAIAALANDEADVAFAQGGATAPKGHGSEHDCEVFALGSLSYAPVWVLYRGEPIDELHDLKGKRVSVGARHSGTEALARTMLAAAGADQPPTTLLELPSDEAIARLGRGELDAAILVLPAESPVIKESVAIPGVRLLSLSLADAWGKRFRYLHRVVLPRGVFDLAGTIPDRDVTLVAPTTNLLASDELHPALAYLLLRAATEVHSPAGLLDGPGEFPAPGETGFKLSPEARRYHKNGVPFLQRFLPFWAANLVDRLWLMLVPLVAVLLPLGRAVPSLLSWRQRQRVLGWYARLKEIELELDREVAEKELREMLARLERAEADIHKSATPISQAENLYVFRVHVDVVRKRILRRLEGHQAV